MEALIGGHSVRFGYCQFVYGSGSPDAWAIRVLRRAAWRSALSVFVAVDGEVIGALLLADELRRETPRAIQNLRSAGVARIIMVTGDHADSAETIGAALDIDAVLSDREPADKVDAVVAEQRQFPTIMVGGGVNDAPALAAADVGIAMGAHGASASSEAADVVILVDRLDRVADAIAIAKRARSIALQSVIAGMAMSAAAMSFAAFGLLPPIAGAMAQEAIDVLVILNALRALSTGRKRNYRRMPTADGVVLRTAHKRIEPALDRMREIADILDNAHGSQARQLIVEANQIVTQQIAPHERDDETAVYPRVARFLSDRHGLSAMSRAHREIIHLARLLRKLADSLSAEEIDRYAARDGQRLIEMIESLARLHNAREKDVYEHALSA